MKKLFLITTLGLTMFCCDKKQQDKATTASYDNTLDFLKQNADYIHEINGFYIVGSAKAPTAAGSTKNTTGLEVFEHSVRLFSSFLDQNNNGVLDPKELELNKKLAKTMLFINGPLAMVDNISENKMVTQKGLYGMSMQTDNWEYVKGYTGKGWSIDKLNSSTWRPTVFNALWEEVFHTITEAFSRTDNDFSFASGALRTYMDADIAAKTYDISVQNIEEGGMYDKITAVNEYIHQIWAIDYAGHSDKLNTHQKKALQFLKDKNVPMQLNPNYTKMFGNRLQ